MAKASSARKLVPLIVGLVLLLTVLDSSPPALAELEMVKWLKVNIPTEGRGGNWVLARSSDIQHLVPAIDGSLYCYANPSGTSYTLFKSTDKGRSWSYTGDVRDNIVSIATARNDANTLYYATASNVYKSTDGAKNFTQLLPNPGGAGSGNVTITAINVGLMGSKNIIAVGTKDADTSQFGGVYILDESKPLSGWIDTSLRGYDVYAVAFSPSFNTDLQLVAVATNETDTFVTTKFGGAEWGATVGNARLDKDNSGGSVVVDTSADIGFPSDYNSDVTAGRYLQFVAVDAGSENGDVYMINGAPGRSVATDLNIGSVYGLSNVDVTSLAIIGNAHEAKLLAGAAGAAEVYFSHDGGTNWLRSTKPPTGGSKTYVLMEAKNGRAYAATSGTESAFSITKDGGVSWNQVALIDTAISDIVDLGLSPNYSRDNTLFLITYGGNYSLWRSLDDGNKWERVLCSTLTNIDNIKLVSLSPQYGSTGQVVFITGASRGNSAIWKSTDNGQSFGHPRLTRDPTTGASFDIRTWALVNNNTLFIGSYDGTNGLVYHTTNSGLSYSTPAITGNQSLNSMVLSPKFDEDETILVGNRDGWVYLSNNGATFESLPRDATSPPLSGKITVAFDPGFSKNRTLYAASDTAGKGIYRFIIGTSANWTSIDSTLPSGGRVSQLVVSGSGVLYAANSLTNGGMERSLDPTYPLGPTFETVTRGLSTGATLIGLWMSGNRLWSVDTINTRLMTFIDSLASQLPPVSPRDKALGIGAIINYTISNVGLDWETLKGAISYKWQLDYDGEFSSVPSGFEGTTKASSARLPSLDPATTYYWRVRATEPVLSPWSDKWSFTTSIGTEAIAPKLISPVAGASEVPLTPLFQWSAVAGAESYELVVSTDVSLSNPVILKIGAYALPSTAWQSNVGLNYNTTYYWKVRAIGSNTQSAWSAIGSFTTQSPPKPLPPPPEPSPKPPLPEPPPSPPPLPVQQPTLDWVIYLFGGLLLVIVLLLITMLVMVVILRRS